jgi:hypothetical protein
MIFIQNVVKTVHSYQWTHTHREATYNEWPNCCGLPEGSLPHHQRHVGGEALVLQSRVGPPQTQQDVRRELLQHTRLPIASRQTDTGQGSVWRRLSPGMLRRAVWWILTDVSEILPPSSGRWHSIPEDSHLHTRRRENLNSHIVRYLWLTTPSKPNWL